MNGFVKVFYQVCLRNVYCAVRLMRTAVVIKLLEIEANQEGHHPLLKTVYPRPQGKFLWTLPFLQFSPCTAALGRLSECKVPTLALWMP